MNPSIQVASLFVASMLASESADSETLALVASTNKNIGHVRVVSGNAHSYPSQDGKSLNSCGGDYYLHIVADFKGLDRVIGVRVDSNKVLTPGNEYIMFWSFLPYSPRVAVPEEYIYKNQQECEASLRENEHVDSEWIATVVSNGSPNGRVIEFANSSPNLPIPREASPTCSVGSCYSYDAFVTYLKESLK